MAAVGRTSAYRGSPQPCTGPLPTISTPLWVDQEAASLLHLIPRKRPLPFRCRRERFPTSQQRAKLRREQCAEKAPPETGGIL
jgi:hypothetical protein